VDRDSGEFVRFIYGDKHGIHRPRSVACDKEGNLVVIENGGRVRIFNMANMVAGTGEELPEDEELDEGERKYTEERTVNRSGLGVDGSWIALHRWPSMGGTLQVSLYGWPSMGGTLQVSLYGWHSTGDPPWVALHRLPSMGGTLQVSLYRWPSMGGTLQVSLYGWPSMGGTLQVALHGWHFTGVTLRVALNGWCFTDGRLWVAWSAIRESA